MNKNTLYMRRTSCRLRSNVSVSFKKSSSINYPWYGSPSGHHLNFWSGSCLSLWYESGSCLSLWCGSGSYLKKRLKPCKSSKIGSYPYILACNLEIDANPDPAYHLVRIRIRIQHIILMRIRILPSNLMRIWIRLPNTVNYCTFCDFVLVHCLWWWYRLLRHTR